ncbi:MAG TPA: 1,6-anhydro-N-acetylmuramyl-L-alanine amidase AmpD [Gammaproteobacteria bacterium]|nr:1,6-anhydro-N-acetylmuramyl-L-alanine amidase AmpD [Gammaproteobacteria bacterium]
MKINPSTGLLQNGKHVPSPNCDARPEETEISLIVIHSISLPPGRYGGDEIEQFFQNRLDKDAHPYFAEIHELKVSAHVLIKRSGEIVQFVPFHQRAWHAGVSSYNGRERCNDFSVGIELEGTDTEPFEEEQYQQLARLIRALRDTWPAIGDNITGHCDIAPGRKTDPGSGFDWQRLNQLLDSNFSEKTL